MYKPRFFTKLIPSMTVTVLLLNLLAPVGLVFAQDGSPPADPPPAEEVGAADATLEEPTDEVVEESPAEEPAETENEEDSGSDLAGAAGTEEEAGTETEADSSETPAEEQAEDTELVEETEASSSDEAGDDTSSLEEEAGDAETAEETDAEAEENPIAEAVEALDEADAMLLDEEGEPLAMATQEAAAALTAPDPQFCPAGSAYGDAACGTSHLTMADAITDALAAAGSGISGTIFVDAGAFTGFTLSGFTFGTSLTIQGNANNGGTTNYTSAVVVDNTNTDFNLTFNDVTFDLGVSVDGMVGDLSFNDVVANNAGGDGIFVDNLDGSVSLDNVTANGTGGDGASIDNTASSTDEGVTVSNSNFNNNILDDGLQILTDGTTTITNVNANGNLENGIEIDSSGAVTLNNVTANMNSDDGVDIDNGNAGSTENVSITGLTVEQNGSNGVFIATGGEATLTNVNANTNDDNGVRIFSTGASSLTSVTAENNMNDGIVVSADGVITLNNVNANNNDDEGAVLLNGVAAAPAVNVFNSNFNGNGATAQDGIGLDIASYGTVTLNNVSASNNTGSTDTNFGAIIDNTGLGNDAAVNISNSVFNGNIGVLDGTGLEVISEGQITLNGVQANNNQATDAAGEAYGLYIENYGTGSGVTINNSSFNSNVGSDYGVGIQVEAEGQITLNGVQANNNEATGSFSEAYGAFLDNSCGCSGAGVSISNSSFNENVGDDTGAGLEVLSAGQITLNNVQANLNESASGGGLGATLVNIFSPGNAGVVVTDSNFNNNTGDLFGGGLGVFSNGAITLKNVAANGNTSANGDAIGSELSNADGADVDAQVTVINSSFNNNVGLTDGVGLVVTSQGTIHLWGVSANGNSVDGVDLLVDPSYGPASVQIYCSFMQNNGDTGIVVDADGGDLKIASTDTSGNGVAPLDINNVTNTIFGQTNCDPGSGDDDRDDGKHAPLDPKDPTTIVLDLYPHSVTFPPMNLLECTGYVKSLFYASDLPAELYAGDDFLRAMKIRIEGCDIPDGGMFTIGFEIPAAEQGNEFAILFWDGSSWVEVPGQLSADGRYTGTWPETGYFVLVTR